MKQLSESRRQFLGTLGLMAGSALLPPRSGMAQAPPSAQPQGAGAPVVSDHTPADYTLHIKTTPVEIAPNHVVTTTSYNGQVPGPLLRFKEGQQVIVDVFNDTDIPEQLHWHGQLIPSDVDGAAEEGSPYIPNHGMRRIVFTPKPAGFRLYHTHNRAGSNLKAGMYSGQVGAVYIEPRHEPGNYDREVFLVLKEFEPTFSPGGDMDMDFLAPATIVKALEAQGKAAMKASLAKGMPHGYEADYDSFTINGRMLGHGEPIRAKSGERILLHVLNASATEIRSLALPGHTFQVVALDGNPVPRPATVPVLWLGNSERISAVVQMDHPGVWILGDIDDDDRRGGMGIIVEYAGSQGEGRWVPPPAFRWNYALFAQPGVTPAAPDEVFEMTFARDNAAEHGFNRWTINGVAFPMNVLTPMPPASFHLHAGKRYRIRMHNASDDIHPIHLHRHTFELTGWGGKPTAGINKDVLMLGSYQIAEVDFVANNPGPTLFHCHQQLHMDYGFMTLFDYV